MKSWLRLLACVCALVAGCNGNEHDVTTIEQYGGLTIPTYEGPLANEPPVDAVLFDPAKRVINDDDFAAVFPCIKQLSPHRLDLHGQDVSDRSVALIVGLADLRWVNVMGTKITAEGIGQLRAPSNGRTTTLQIAE